VRRAIIFLLLFGLLPVPRPAAPAASVIQEGTPVLLLTEEKMVSGETPEGSTVLYKVERDVLGPQGQVLIPAGARAHGKVLKSSGSGFFGTAGELNINIESVEAVDKTVVPLRAVRDATADDSTAGMIVGAVLLSVFFVFMEGDDVVIPAGTLFSGYVNRDTKLGAPGPVRNIGGKSAKMIGPGAMRKEDQMFFACTATPDDPQAYVRLLVDGKMVGGQKGALNKIVWDTRRNEKLTEELAKEGKHKVAAEVTWSNGEIVRSEPVEFTIID
jgi:hypothetical protein